MLQVDVLSGYFICGASSLVGAGMLRMAESPDARTLVSLRLCMWGFVVLGLGLVPTGFHDLMAQSVGKFSVGFAALAGILLVGQGVARVQGHGWPMAWTLAAIALAAAVLGAALPLDARGFTLVFVGGMTLVCAQVTWHSRGIIAHPRDVSERMLGLTMVSMLLTSALRLVLTLQHEPQPRIDLMYVPAPWGSMMAALYGVLPMVVATLLLNLVNARLHHQLHMRAATDELTGAMTRRALRELAPPLLREQQQRQHDVAVMMLDLDHFKAINDGHGHPAGDAVLQLAARVLQTQLRFDALLARYGGEEFVAVVPVDGLPSARRVAERLRHAVETTDWRGRLQIARDVTISVGVAMAGPAEALDAVLQRADEALYRAKRDGRNQCQFALAAA